MKVFAFSGDGKYIKIGETNETAQWYAITSAVKNFIKNISKGDEVEVRATKNSVGKLELQFINVTKKASDSGFAPRYGKTPEEQESIKRQAIGHMVSRSLIALQGQVDVNNIQKVAEELYKKYQELVG